MTFLTEAGAVGTEVLLVVPSHIPGLPWSHTATLTTNTRHAHPWRFGIHWFRVRWSQAGRVVAGLASPALQHRLRLLASAAAHVTELAASATPVLLGLLLGALVGCKAEIVERFAADLAEYHLVLSFTGAKQTDRLRSGVDRGENAEATH